MSAVAAPSAAVGAAVAPFRPPRLLFLPATGRLWLRFRSRGRLAALAPLRSLATADGPSCIFVGPLETASQEMLEALYHQARDSYYSGEPLIVDDMFDKVELKLRFYGSKSVVKYPRCSLRRQLTYADAEEDPSQVFALASIWSLLLAFGGFALLIPTIYSISLSYHDITSSIFASNSRSPMEWLTMVNGILFMGLGYLIGCPVASASVKALKGLWRNDLVALKGSCPNCGEEVFAFVKADQRPHKAECHVCESRLEFRTKVEGLSQTIRAGNEIKRQASDYNMAKQSASSLKRHWVYGRVYLVSRRSIY